MAGSDGTDGPSTLPGGTGRSGLDPRIFKWAALGFVPLVLVAVFVALTTTVAEEKDSYAIADRYVAACKRGEHPVLARPTWPSDDGVEQRIAHARSVEHAGFGSTKTMGCVMLRVDDTDVVVRVVRGDGDRYSITDVLMGKGCGCYRGADVRCPPGWTR